MCDPPDRKRMKRLSLLIREAIACNRQILSSAEAVNAPGKFAIRGDIPVAVFAFVVRNQRLQSRWRQPFRGHFLALTFCVEEVLIKWKKRGLFLDLYADLRETSEWLWRIEV